MKKISILILLIIALSCENSKLIEFKNDFQKDIVNAAIDRTNKTIIYNLEGDDRDEFTSDMPWILKKFVLPVIWKKKWAKMKPFLLV